MQNHSLVLGDPEITANMYCSFAYLYWEGCLICSIYICGNFWSPRRASGKCEFALKVHLTLFSAPVGAVLPRDPVLQEECRRDLA